MTITTAPTNGTNPMLEVDQAAEAIRLFLIQVGQATKTEIREYCKAEHSISTEVYQKALARLLNQYKIVTEVSREDGSKALELKRNIPKVSVFELAELVLTANAPKEPREKYLDWYELSGALVLTSVALASRPVLGNPSARAFEKDVNGDVLFNPGNYIAMFKQAMSGLPGAPEIKSGVRYHVYWDQQTVSASLITTELCPVPPDRPGGQGKGLTEVEALPPGTEIPFRVVAPGSHISPTELKHLLYLAGRWVGFSPSGAHKGRGRFVPRVEQEG